MGSLTLMLVSQAGLSPVMVGRDVELEQLRRLAAAVSAPTVALIGGEPGIGKTRLVAELIATVPSGTTVLACQAEPDGLGRPYQLLRELVGPRHPLAAALTQRDPMARRRAALALIRTAFRNPVGARRSATAPLLVADDLQWADPESLAILSHLDDVITGPALLVGTYQPGDLDRRHPLAGMLDRLERRRGVTHLRLGRLAPTDTARFLAARYGRAPARRTVTTLHHRSGGLPVFLEELLRWAGDADLDDIPTRALPWSLNEAVVSRLDTLGAEPRQVAEAAAVLGRPATPARLAALCELAEPEVAAALRHLVRHGLLVEVAPGRFRFGHRLIREAVYQAVPARRRRHLHESAWQELRRCETPDLIAVAGHARGAGRYAELVEAARQGAAERLADGAAYPALTLAELALEEAPDDPELRTLAATAASRTGRLPQARQHAAEGLRVATDDPTRVAALTQLIHIAWEDGALDEMDTHTEQVRRLAGRLPDGEVRARASAAVAQSYLLRRRSPGEALSWADRAFEIAERHGLKELRIVALVERGSALQLTPATAREGRRLLTEVATEAEHTGAHLAAAHAWHNLFWCLPPGEATAPAVLERMRASAERAGMGGTALGAYHHGRAWLAVLAGDLDGAIAVLERARRFDREAATVDPATGAPFVLHLSLSSGQYPRGQLAGLYLERGDLEMAEALLATPAPSPRWRRATVGLSFQLACWRGEGAAARKLLAELTALLDTPPLPDAADLHAYVSAGLSVGLPAGLLRPLVERDTGQVDRPDLPDHPLRVLIRAQLVEAERHYQEALTKYAAAIRAAVPQGCASAVLAPAHRGTAAVGMARCLVTLGRLDEARPYIDAAHEHLARWPGWRRAELVSLTHRLGAAGVAAGPAGGRAPLTPREREVASLLADGLTNTEIARRLLISRKTVAVHVSHILAKLDMSSRTQVAAWVASRSR